MQPERAISVAPATPARNARAPVGALAVVDCVLHLRVAPGVAVELHDGIGKLRALLWPDGGAPCEQRERDQQ